MTDEGFHEAEEPSIGVGMGGSCPECRAPVDLAQEFCLECGAPIRFRAKPRAKKPAAQAPVQQTIIMPPKRGFPWVPFVIVLLLVVGGVLFAVFAGDEARTGDRDKRAKTEPNTLGKVTTSEPPDTSTNVTVTSPGCNAGEEAQPAIVDADGDGVADTDVNGDGTPDIDLDGDGQPDVDVNGDGQPDVDADGDGQPDSPAGGSTDTITPTLTQDNGAVTADQGVDNDQDGQPDTGVDSDGDGVFDPIDTLGDDGTFDDGTGGDAGASDLGDASTDVPDTSGESGGTTVTVDENGLLCPTGTGDTGATDTGATDTGVTDTTGTDTDGGWPAGTSGFTVILLGFSKADGYTQADANRKSADAQGAGLTDAGVLDSDQFSSLCDGFWVVFSGVYKKEPDAEAALDDAKDAGYTAAYVRPINNEDEATCQATS